MGERCFICGYDNQHVLQQHHIVPRRHGGDDGEDNLVTLCANCHEAIEKIYSEDRWEQAFLNYRQSEEGPYVSEFSDKQVCPECLRRWNPETDTVELTEGKSPLYD